VGAEECRFLQALPRTALQLLPMGLDENTVDWAVQYKKARNKYIWTTKNAPEKVAEAKEHYKKMELAYLVDQLLHGKPTGLERKTYYDC